MAVLPQQPRVAQPTGAADCCVRNLSCPVSSEPEIPQLFFLSFVHSQKDQAYNESQLFSPRYIPFVRAASDRYHVQEQRSATTLRRRPAAAAATNVRRSFGSSGLRPTISRPIPEPGIAVRWPGLQQLSWTVRSAAARRLQSSAEDGLLQPAARTFPSWSGTVPSPRTIRPSSRLPARISAGLPAVSPARTIWPARRSRHGNGWRRGRWSSSRPGLLLLPRHVLILSEFRYRLVDIGSLRHSKTHQNIEDFPGVF